MNKAQKQKVREDFREKFLMKGSECTWEGYPEPEEIESYLIQKIEEQERELVGRIEKDLLLNQIYIFAPFDLKEVYGMDKSGHRYKGMRLTPDDIKSVINSLKQDENKR